MSGSDISQKGISGNVKLLVCFSENLSFCRSFSIRNPKGLISFGFLSNFFLVWLSILNTESYAGFSGFELSLIAYWRDSCFLLICIVGS